MTPSLVSSLEQRRALLTAALGFMQLDRWNGPKPPAMTALARWMDSWSGVGTVVIGMAAQGCDLQLMNHELPAGDGDRDREAQDERSRSRRARLVITALPTRVEHKRQSAARGSPTEAQTWAPSQKSGDPGGVVFLECSTRQILGCVDHADLGGNVPTVTSVTTCCLLPRLGTVRPPVNQAPPMALRSRTFIALGAEGTRRPPSPHGSMRAWKDRKGDSRPEALDWLISVSGTS
jgi:hypothetical protein